MSLTTTMTPKPQLLEMLDHAQERIAELEAKLAEAERENYHKTKRLATDFFRWWYNQPGTNTDQGFDEWWSNHCKAIDAAMEDKDEPDA